MAVTYEYDLNDVIVTNMNGDVVTAVGGKDKFLRTWKDVVKMLNNHRGYSTLPYKK